MKIKLKLHMKLTVSFIDESVPENLNVMTLVNKRQTVADELQRVVRSVIQ